MRTKAKVASVFWFFALIGTFFLLGMAGPPDASAQLDDFIITVDQDLVNGKITPVTDTFEIPVPAGGSKLFTITPSKHYRAETITVTPDGEQAISLNLSTSGAVDDIGTLTVPTGSSKVYKFNFTNVSKNYELTATFTIDRYNLTVDKTSQSSGRGTVTGRWTDIETGNPGTFECGDTCTGEGIPYNTVVELTADEDLRDVSIFEKWSGCKKDTLNNKKCTIVVKNHKTVKAKFTHTHTLTVTIAGEGSGTVKGPKISCQGDCDEVYKWTLTTTTPKLITLTAATGTSSSFAGWTGISGRDTLTSNPKVVKVLMDNDRDITATFNNGLTAMQIADKVTVIEANPGDTVKPLRMGKLGAPSPPACPDDSKAYCTDETNIYVEESSAQTFNTINEILCSMAQSKYDLMLNKGPYKAQIDKSLCKSGKDDASSAGESSQNTSSGASMPDYEMWTVDSSRPDDNSPQIVKAWIHQKASGYDPEMLIYAQVVITDGVSEANPYGLFTVNFKGNPVINGAPVPLSLMTGFLKTEVVSGRVLLKFISNMDTTTVPPPYNQGIPQFIYRDSATLDKGLGKGTVYTYELSEWAPQGDDVTYDIAFDDIYFHKMEPDDVETEMCLDRNDFNESVWSYGLYNQDGSRVERNSGFSIKTTAGGQDVYGWIGYWGLWLPNDVTVDNGATVYKVNYGGPGGPEEVPYTVLKSGGKLKKYTLNPMTLLDIKNVPLNYNEGMGPQGSMYQVKWDGTNFTKFSKMNPDTNMWEALPQGEPTTIDLSALTNDMLFFYSQALNGNAQVKLNYAGGCTIVSCPENSPCIWSCPASDSTPVNTYTENLIYPSDTVPASLVCFANCPDVTKLSDQDPFFHYDWEPQIGTLPEAEGTQHATYTFNTNVLDPMTVGVTTMVLMSGTTPVVTTNLAQNFQWGLMSGPLFDPSDLHLLECEMDPMNPADPDSTCGWKTWSELSTYYIWETGPNSWNQFTMLKDSDPFQPPLQVSYEHRWQEGEGGVVGTTSTFNLEYSGFGNLHGIPGKCIDPDTGNNIPCGPDSRWIPQFNIPEGAPVDDVVTVGTTYFVKPLEMEQRMSQVETSNCSTLTLQTFDVPTINQISPFDIGEEPPVDGPPKVIGGEVMY